VGDIGFSGPQLTLLAAVATPLLGTIGVLFRTLLAAKDAHLASKDGEIARAAEALEEALVTNKELSAAVKEATVELRELRQDLWKERRVGDWRQGPT
jgi:hypothetical protein